jgi:hypothetical protein
MSGSTPESMKMCRTVAWIEIQHLRIGGIPMVDLDPPYEVFSEQNRHLEDSEPVPVVVRPYQIKSRTETFAVNGTRRHPPGRRWGIPSGRRS